MRETWCPKAFRPGWAKWHLASDIVHPEAARRPRQIFRSFKWSSFVLEKIITSPIYTRTNFHR